MLERERTQKDIDRAKEYLEEAERCSDDPWSQLAQVIPLINVFYDGRYLFPEAKELLDRALRIAAKANSEIPPAKQKNL